MKVSEITEARKDPQRPFDDRRFYIVSMGDDVEMLEDSGFLSMEAVTKHLRNSPDGRYPKGSYRVARGSELNDAVSQGVDEDLVDEALSVLSQARALSEDEGGGDAPPEMSSDSPGPIGSGFGRGPVMGGLWFNQLYRTLKTMIVAQNIVKRLKVLGVGGEGARRVKAAAKMAQKHVKLLLANPGATAYTIPVWTVSRSQTPVVKMWKESLEADFDRRMKL